VVITVSWIGTANLPRGLMLSRTELKDISKARLKDAKALLQLKRFDGAVYLCGYAVEIALKARICQSLRWTGYPSTRGEFQNYQTFRTHDLDILLHLSGIEARIKDAYLPEWSVLSTWDPEARYATVGTYTINEASMMIQAARTLLAAL
jgi:hypothetical protein